MNQSENNKATQEGNWIQVNGNGNVVILWGHYREWTTNFQNVPEFQLDAPISGEKNHREKPTQEKPVEEKPTQEKPAQEKPVDKKSPEEKFKLYEDAIQDLEELNIQDLEELKKQIGKILSKRKTSS